MKNPFQNSYLRTLLLLVVLNLSVKPIWIFGIDRQVQNLTGFASYGAYYAMLSYCFLFSMVLDPGLHIRLSRDAASTPDRLPAILSEAIRVKFMLILGFWVGAILVARVWGIQDWATLLPVALLFSCASFFSMIRHFLSGSQLFRQDALLSVADKTLVILLMAPLIIFPHMAGRVNIHLFIWVQVASLLTAIILGIRSIVSHIGPLRIRFAGRLDLDAFRSGFPFAVNAFLMGMVMWTDGFLLERLHPSGAEEAGLYAAGFRLLDAFGMLGSLVGVSLLSYISGLWAERGDFQPAFVAARKTLMLGAILLATSIWAYPAYFTDLLYHRKDGPLIPVMGSLMLGLPALYIVHMQGTLLTATGHIATFVRASLIAALLSIALKLLLLSGYGALASAWISVGIYWVYALLLVRGTRSALSTGIDWTEGLLYAMSAMACYGLLRFLLYFGFNTLLSVMLASGLTAAVFVRVGGVRFKEIWDVLKGK